MSLVPSGTLRFVLPGAIPYRHDTGWISMSRKPTDQFKLRISAGLRRRIEREAAKRAMTANALAVEQLEQAFDQKETRDTAIVDFLVGENQEAKVWLRWLVLQLQTQKEWQTEKGRKELAEAFRQRVLTGVEAIKEIQ
jgi:hypothetical protein